MTEPTLAERFEASRDRLRALGRPGATLEETLVTALDALEREQFWAEAEAAASRRRAMPDRAGSAARPRRLPGSCARIAALRQLKDRRMYTVWIRHPPIISIMPTSQQ